MKKKSASALNLQMSEIDDDPWRFGGSKKKGTSPKAKMLRRPPDMLKSDKGLENLEKKDHTPPSPCDVEMATTEKTRENQPRWEEPTQSNQVSQPQEQVEVELALSQITRSQLSKP